MEKKKKWDRMKKNMLLCLLAGVMVILPGCGKVSTETMSRLEPAKDYKSGVVSEETKDSKDSKDSKSSTTANSSKSQDAKPLQAKNQLPEDGVISQEQLETIAGAALANADVASNEEGSPADGNSTDANVPDGNASQTDDGSKKNGSRSDGNSKNATSQSSANSRDGFSKDSAVQDNGSTHKDGSSGDGYIQKDEKPDYEGLQQEDDKKPDEQTKPNDQTKPGGETKPDNQVKPGGETKPDDQTKPDTPQQPAKPEKHVCTISIDCVTLANKMDMLADENKAGFVPADGQILGTAEVEFTPGQTVYDVLVKICQERKIQMEASFTPMYGSYYVEGINNLYEFDGGALSGWMYNVNGWYPNYGCSSYVLSDNDKIEWRYTLDLGEDVGGLYAVTG